jgi:hypothetical protein
MRRRHIINKITNQGPDQYLKKNKLVVLVIKYPNSIQ